MTADDIHMLRGGSAFGDKEMPDQNYNTGDVHATGARVDTIKSIKREWNHELTRKQRKMLAVEWPFMYRMIMRLIDDELFGR